MCTVFHNISAHLKPQLHGWSLLLASALSYCSDVEINVPNVLDVWCEQYERKRIMQMGNSVAFCQFSVSKPSIIDFHLYIHTHLILIIHHQCQKPYNLSYAQHCSKVQRSMTIFYFKIDFYF